MAFRVACLEMFAVYSLVIPAPVMRGAVKARQACKNVEVWVRAICFSLLSKQSVVSSSFCGLLLFSLSQASGAPFACAKIFPINSGRPLVGGAGSQSSVRREVSERRALVN